MIFGVVPRRLAIVVAVVVVLFLLVVVIGQVREQPRKTRDGYEPPAPNAFTSLFDRPTPVKPNVLTGTCTISGDLVTATTTSCLVTVAASDKKGQARELKLHVEPTSNPAMLSTSAEGKTVTKSPDDKRIVAVGFGDDEVTVEVKCPSANCQLRVVS